ncbi:alpha/beta hydrolase family esterase [Sinomicrobium sp. M5D2P17]
MKLLIYISALFIVVTITALRWRHIVNPNKKGSFVIDNLKRTFIYHVPKYLKPNPKLILVYHGTGMKTWMMQLFTGHEFDRFSDCSQDAIIVYPQGYETSWNDCRKIANTPPKKLNLDDVGFTEKIIGYFQNKYQIDSKEIYAVGFSNGGQFAMRLMNEKPGLFKGFAIMSAQLSYENETQCKKLPNPVSLIVFNGMKDPIIPYNGGEVILKGKSYGHVYSAEQSVLHWLTASRCDTIPTSTHDFKNKRDEVTAVQQFFSSIETGKKVSFVKMLNGGHQIPNKKFSMGIPSMGYVNKEVDAPRLIWDFFESLK